MLVWNRTLGCRWWETDNETVGGQWGTSGNVLMNGSSSPMDWVYIHNVRLSKDGKTVREDNSGTVTQQTVNVTGVQAHSSSNVTLELSSLGSPGLQAAATVVTSGVSPSGYNNTWVLTNVGASCASGDANSVCFAVTSDPGAYVSGGSLTWPPNGTRSCIVHFWDIATNNRFVSQKCDQHSSGNGRWAQQ